jgi:receptor tyrosine kinase
MYIFVILLAVLEFCNGETQSCGPYHGNICKNYRNGKIVWYNNSGGFENEEITKGLWGEVIERLEEPCRRAAEVTYADK